MKTIMRMGVRLAMAAFFVFCCCEATAPNIFSLHNSEATAAYATDLYKSSSSGADLSAIHTSEVNTTALAQPILRLHVIAHSNSDEDQRIKLAVRDELVRRFSPAGSLQEAEELLLMGGEDVQRAVEDVLQAEGCAYGAQLRMGVMDFPARQYEQVTYPAGEYEALRVELGAAEGENWWCVLFPPLCLVDAGVEDLPDTDELVFESDLLALLKDLKVDAGDR